MFSKLHPAILFLCVLLASRAFAEDLDLPKLAKTARKAVVFIRTESDDGKVYTGSGFFVSADGKLMTNWHVIEGARAAYIKMDNGEVYKISKIISGNQAIDFALLQVNVKGAVPFLVLGNDEEMEIGQKIAVIGSPLGIEFDNTVSEGIISGRRESNGIPWIQITAPISHGSSGSPVMNAKGEVIGIASGAFTEGQNLNTAVPINIAKQLLAKHLKNPTEAPQQVLADPRGATATSATSGTTVDLKNPSSTATQPPAPSVTDSTPLPDIDDRDDPAYKREHPFTAAELSREETPLGHLVKKELDEKGAAGAVYKRYLMKFWKRGS